jgi:hypothetical protein
MKINKTVAEQVAEENEARFNLDVKGRPDDPIKAAIEAKIPGRVTAEMDKDTGLMRRNLVRNVRDAG